MTDRRWILALIVLAGIVLAREVRGMLTQQTEAPARERGDLTGELAAGTSAVLERARQITREAASARPNL